MKGSASTAISAPLIHGERVLGVLNLSHSLRRGAFSEEDRDFVARLAAIDAKIITRAEEYHRLLRDSARLQGTDNERQNRKRLRADQPLIEPLYTPEDAEAIITRLRQTGDAIDTLAPAAQHALLESLIDRLEIDMDSRQVELDLRLPPWAIMSTHTSVLVVVTSNRTVLARPSSVGSGERFS